MNLISAPQGNALAVQLADPRLDAAIAIQFKDRMRELARNAPGDVHLDLSRVTFLDSSGLGALVSVMKSLAPERRLVLSGLTANVAKVFRLTRMDSVFAIVPPSGAHHAL